MIVVKNAPTWFGTIAYEIVSDVEGGKIAATVEMPSRTPSGAVRLRLRHPKALLISSVTVNGRPWTDFCSDREVISLHGLTGKVAVVAKY